MEVCLGGLAAVSVQQNAVTGFWCPGKVMVEVLKVVEGPGFVSARSAAQT